MYHFSYVSCCLQMAAGIHGTEGETFHTLQTRVGSSCCKNCPFFYRSMQNTSLTFLLSSYTMLKSVPRVSPDPTLIKIPTTLTSALCTEHQNTTQGRKTPNCWSAAGIGHSFAPTIAHILKCHIKVLFPHKNPEQLQCSLSQILQVCGTLLEE